MTPKKVETIELRINKVKKIVGHLGKLISDFLKRSSIKRLGKIIRLENKTISREFLIPKPSINKLKKSTRTIIIGMILWYHVRL